MITITFPYGLPSWMNNEVDSWMDDEIGSYEIEANDLAEAISFIEKTFGDTITKNTDDEKYYKLCKGRPPGNEFELVDIHVTRNGQEICPKQDTSFKLISGDIIMFNIEIMIC